jgi:hypothetical protein
MRDRPGRRAPGCGTRLRSGARRRPSLSRSRGCRDVSRRRRPQHAQPAAVITARAFVPPFRCAPARFVRRLPRLHAPLSHELGGVIAAQEAARAARRRARHRHLITFCTTLATTTTTFLVFFSLHQQNPSTQCAPCTARPRAPQADWRDAGGRPERRGAPARRRRGKTRRDGEHAGVRRRWRRSWARARPG